MNATSISEEAIPALVEALRDPEVQVRANCAHALARLDVIPAAAIPLLIECTADANDGLRMSAARALKLAPAEAVIDCDAAPARGPELAGPSDRGQLTPRRGTRQHPGRCRPGGGLWKIPVLRVREAALALLESLGEGGTAILDGLKENDGQSQELDSLESTLRGVPVTVGFGNT